MRSTVIAGLLGMTIACASPVTPNAQAPTAPTNLRVLTRWVISGQSNAVRLAPFLTPFTTDLQSASQDSTPISAWAADGPLWAQLAPELTDRTKVFIWWQGESDIIAGMTPAAYALKLDELLARVRATAHYPGLPVILCGVNSYTGYDGASFRTMQQTYAATHAHVTFVRSDDLPPYLNHLTPDGYQLMAARVAAVVEEQ